MKVSQGYVRARKIHIDLNPKIKETLQKIGDDCAKDIQKASPVGYTGKYAKGWTYKMTRDTKGDSLVIIFNDGKHKSLSHLLELGHRSRSGSMVPPQEHMRPNFAKYSQKYFTELKTLKIEPKK